MTIFGDRRWRFDVPLWLLLAVFLSAAGAFAQNPHNLSVRVLSPYGTGAETDTEWGPPGHHTPWLGDWAFDIWKDDFGFRVSGSGWYDPQYKNDENDHPSDYRYTWASPSADFGDFNHEAEDLHYAGGIQAVMKELGDHDMLNMDCRTATGKTVGQNLEGAIKKDQLVIRPVTNPYHKEGGLAVLFGNLAPEGCVVKQSAVLDKMLKHQGPARVFNSEEEATEGGEAPKPTVAFSFGGGKK